MITKNDLSLLIKFKNKKSINKEEFLNIEHLQKLKLIEIDDLYVNSVMNVVIYYAKTTELGNNLIKQNKKKSIFKLFKK